MSNSLVTLATALMFLTRLPVGRFASGDPQILARSVVYFPLVGAVVAFFMSVVLGLATTVLPLTVAVSLAILVGILVTGAFHEDGVADVADSAGAFDIDRKLNIMRDSRVGTYGSLGLLLTILLRFTLVWELAKVNVQTAMIALLLAHACSRWGSAYLMAKVQYARAEAANKVVAEGVTDRVLAHATIVMLAVIALPAMSLSLWLLLTVPLALLVSMACGAYFKKVFNGITGDCLGAANVIVEIVCLMGILAGFHVFIQRAF